MSYELTNWKKGDKVTSTRLNKIENGIQGNDEEITELKEDLNGTGYFLLSESDLQQGEWVTGTGITSTTSRLCTKNLYKLRKGMQIKYTTSDALAIEIRVFNSAGTRIEVLPFESTSIEKTYTLQNNGDVAFIFKRTSGSYMNTALYTSSGAVTKIYNTIGSRVELLEEQQGAGVGNSEYFGEVIPLQTPVKTNRCNVTLWKNYKSADYPDLADYHLNANQCIAIHGNYLFMINSDNTVAIANFLTKELVTVLTLADINSHQNSAQFTNIYYDVNDEFPLLLISRCASTSLEYADECFVFRIVRNSNTFTFTLINTIQSDVRTYGSSWFIDNNNKLIGFVGKITSDAVDVVYYTWSYPSATDILSGNTITLNKSDCISYAKTEATTFQSACANGGIVYVGMGEGNETEYVFAVDITKGVVIAKVPMPINNEIEGVYIYNHKMYVSQRVSSDSSAVSPLYIYEITF